MDHYIVRFHFNQLKVFGVKNASSHLKDQIILATCRGIMTDFWVPHDIESCNFQNLLVFGFPETYQNLMSFRQLLFSLFHGGDQRKKSENPKKCQMSGIHI